jgi:hypothetical protein
MADNDSQKQRGLDEEAQSSMWAPRCRAPPTPSPLITPRLLEPPPPVPPPRPLALRYNRRAPVPQLVCAMFGATTRFSRWGQVVIWHGGRPALRLLAAALLADPATSEALGVVARWLGFVSALLLCEGKHCDSAIDLGLVAGARFWRRAAWKRHTVAAAELAMVILGLGLPGLRAAAHDLRMDLVECARWTGSWVLVEPQLRAAVHGWDQRFLAALQTACAAATLLARRLAPTSARMRAWPYLQADSTLLDVALWLLLGGMPCVSAFGSILRTAPTTTLLELELCSITEQEAARAVQRDATASATEDDPTYRAWTFSVFDF